ncbi:receptor-interacting serine/threonine-protein kinase 3 [Echeneis naucrates]|uniref:Receptor-interacting serine/threonine-protein kinase 3-like n=1 Tax=Echeneis naucrates TaxID=173247 RepID=A0A665V7B6_ECHNA|nr:receptor-interacting serine/threonine-protein kinase 3-like [Echeneis naucrates]
MSSDSTPAVIEDCKLQDWKLIDSGGFGQIFKARHRELCSDVAVKLLHHDDGNSTALQHEVKMMCRGSNPYVIQVLGVFRGRPPRSGLTDHLGLVMEYMERGSLASLQKTLCETPPWPLVFRLANQVALGINFLHNLIPALLHLDLKPSNVLLDFHLNAKLTDFGLSKYYTSLSRLSKKNSNEEGGTISYMPPEAFAMSTYKPTQASDIYSYGILLWSLVTGKQPYPDADPCIVQFRIPQGDRPSLEEVRSQAAGCEGLTGLMELMITCWGGSPTERPSSFDCTAVTEDLFKMHKHAINEAVYKVTMRLDEKKMAEQFDGIHITQPSGSSVGVVNNFDNVPTGRPPVQEMSGGWPANQRDKEESVKDPTPPEAVSHIDHLFQTKGNDKKRVSSVQPIRSSQHSPPLRSTPPPGGAADGPQRPFTRNLPTLVQRQSSSPSSLPNRSIPKLPHIHINMSHVNGFQCGSNNTMHIDHVLHPLASERRRHPTAPPSVDLQPPHLGGRKNQKGGAG